MRLSESEAAVHLVLDLSSKDKGGFDFAKEYTKKIYDGYPLKGRGSGEPFFRLRSGVGSAASNAATAFFMHVLPKKLSWGASSEHAIPSGRS